MASCSTVPCVSAAAKLTECESGRRGDRQTYSSVASALRDCGDAQCADGGRRDPWGPAGLVADPCRMGVCNVFYARVQSVCTSRGVMDGHGMAKKEACVV